MEIKETLILHEKWLNGEEGGKMANLNYADLNHIDLRYMDLSRANLSHTNLSYANLSHVNLSHANLSYADLSYANLSCANLSCANLSYVDLSYADLNHADLDFSCLPLWCGSLTAHFDDRQLKQIAYHLVKAGLQSKNASLEAKTELTKLIDFANEFHRVDECGKIGE